MVFISLYNIFYVSHWLELNDFTKNEELVKNQRQSDFPFEWNSMEWHACITYSYKYNYIR